MNHQINKEELNQTLKVIFSKEGFESTELGKEGIVNWVSEEYGDDEGYQPKDWIFTDNETFEKVEDTIYSVIKGLRYLNAVRKQAEKELSAKEGKSVHIKNFSGYENIGELA